MIVGLEKYCHQAQIESQSEERVMGGDSTYTCTFSSVLWASDPRCRAGMRDGAVAALSTKRANDVIDSKDDQHGLCSFIYLVWNLI